MGKKARLLSLVFGAITAVSGTASAATGNVVYQGGHVISRAEVVLVFWGPHVTQTAVTNMEPFYKAVVNSSYMDWMGEYDTAGADAEDGQPGSGQHIYRGTFLKTVTITPTHTATN